MAAGGWSGARGTGRGGWAVVLTAAGLDVAVPAVLHFNFYGKGVAASEAELEGFAHDLREMVMDASASP